VGCAERFCAMPGAEQAAFRLAPMRIVEVNPFEVNRL
jgi:hypothetical protein